MTEPMPAFFLGHGNPMNALLDNAYSRGWAVIGKEIPRPTGVLSISAHWYIPGTSVTAMPAPRTIHDFGGFPPELYRINFPVPGDPPLADRIQRLLAPISVELDRSWGLDHGTWTVLRHVFPGADIPVVQLSVDKRQPAEFHYEIGKRLAPLRNEGVLIIGSGNLVHNLHAYAWGQHAVDPFDWAVDRLRDAWARRGAFHSHAGSLSAPPLRDRVTAGRRPDTLSGGGSRRRFGVHACRADRVTFKR